MKISKKTLKEMSITSSHQRPLGLSPPPGFIPQVIYLHFLNRLPVFLSGSDQDIQTSHFIPE